MRVDELVEKLQALPFNAEVELIVVDSDGFERTGYEINAIEYNAHTNTTHVRGF